MFVVRVRHEHEQRARITRVMEPRRKRRKRRRDGTPKSKEFMDAAREAFVRYVALEKWREIEDMRETLGFDWTRAAQEAGQFLGRGQYQPLWIRRWEEQVMPQAEGNDAGQLFAAIETAIAAALRDEEEERRIHADRPLDEDPEYKAFIDAALENLFREQAGELEPS